MAVGPDGKPVMGAEVTAGVERDGRAWRGGAMHGRAFSGPDGTFTIEQLGAGKHTLWGCTPGTPTPKGVDGGARGVKLQFPPEATIGGVVTTSDGKPVPDYTIILAAGPKPSETPEQKRQRIGASPFENPTDTVHDPSRRFFFRRVNEGTHELRVKTAAGSGGALTVSVAAGEKKEGVRIAIERGGRVVGRVLDMEGNAPLANVEVRAFSMSMGTRPSTRTDGSGAFALDGIQANEVVALFIQGDPRTHIGERREVEITKGNTVDLGTIRLARASVEARMKEGSWSGLTEMDFSKDDRGSVVQVRPGTPAEKAGLKVGDTILAIDGKSMRGLSYGAIEYHVRGRPGAPIALTVQTPGEQPRTLTFARYDAQAPLPAPATSGGSGGTTSSTAAAARPAQATSPQSGPPAGSAPARP